MLTSELAVVAVGVLGDVLVEPSELAVVAGRVLVEPSEVAVVAVSLLVEPSEVV